MADPCIFCAIVAGEIPATRVREDDQTLAFMDTAPATPGHALVVPKRHSEDLWSIAPEDLAATARAAQEVARLARDNLGAAGVNLLNSCRPEAWQTVFHFHIHVIPRYADDPLRLPWIPAPGDEDEIARAGAKLRGG